MTLRINGSGSSLRNVGPHELRTIPAQDPPPLVDWRARKAGARCSIDGQPWRKKKLRPHHAQSATPPCAVTRVSGGTKRLKLLSLSGFTKDLWNHHCRCFVSFWVLLILTNHTERHKRLFRASVDDPPRQRLDSSRRSFSPHEKTHSLSSWRPTVVKRRRLPHHTQCDPHPVRRVRMR